LLLVIDSNVYIFGFGLVKIPACKNLIYEIIEKRELYNVRIPRAIVEEVRSHLAPEDFSTFIRVINILTTIDEDFLIPFELGAKYEARGFKTADAFIAAYAEWVGADVLVTENRHFLNSNPDLPFKILTAEKCLKLIS
jgi:predicted nucleic acid-binding protein